jgi:outer membrane receptor protein involved in Fe transport
MAIKQASFKIGVANNGAPVTIASKRAVWMATVAALLASAGAGGVAYAAGNTAATSSATTVGEIVVTAQRREENLQDVPIAVSAFSGDKLKQQKLEGGEDLLLQVPNSNYTRTNFGGYDFKIRGIGTDVIGSGSTAGVSVNFNQLPVSANHFQDEEFYDVERVEVLRGPQGTLYGRNATGGAVDVITNQPTHQFGGYGTVEYGNYNTVKATAAINIPLGEAFALRVAGLGLWQDGFGENTYLNQRVDGRALGSIRATLSFKPSNKFDAYLIYEYFNEDDDRNRVGKQLCIKDPGPSNVGGVPVTGAYSDFLNQGCLQGSLYQSAAYGALNSKGTLAGVLSRLIGLNNGTDVFGLNPLQDTNLHNIQSIVQPIYKVHEYLIDLHMAWHVTDHLTLESITGFNRDVEENAQDYNRIVPATPFTPTTALDPPFGAVNAAFPGGLAQYLFPNGVVNDPQIGVSNRLTTFDRYTEANNEYTEELRLISSYSGKFNFSAGVFYSELDQPQQDGDNYYVTSNALTAYAQFNNAIGLPPIGIDPNKTPTGEGHNYYIAHTNVGHLKSYAGFGEIYYNVMPDLKITLGGRYTVDQLYNLSYPIQLLAPGSGFPTTICTGVGCLVPQRVTYREFTGRANIQWTPTLSFTDKSMFYFTYSRGYKGGGFNTPCQSSLASSSGVCPYPTTYDPEFIDSYEIGTKNTLLHGSLQLNLTGFYYDYHGYQISEIVSESSVNLNINAKIYGAEFEAVYSPIRDLTLNANLGVIHSSIDNGTSEIDQLNLNQGNAAYTLLKTTAGSNCLAPTAAVAGYMAFGLPAAGIGTLCTPGTPAATAFGITSNPYQFGIPQNIGGNELPNTPPITLSLGAQYVFHLPMQWNATLRGDYYWQDDSYARIFNAVNDRLHAYDIFNATLTFANHPLGLEVQLYVKNAFDNQPLTGVYLTDATSGLFQNVFTLDPRTFGMQITKRW